MNGLGASTSSLPGGAGGGQSLASAAQLIGESLKNADDLNKISTLRKKIKTELASVESKLRAGAKDQLDATRDGISRLMDTRVAVGEIREQFVNVDRLCDDERTFVEGFDKIGEVGGNPAAGFKWNAPHAVPVCSVMQADHSARWEPTKTTRSLGYTETLSKRSTW